MVLSTRNIASYYVSAKQIYAGLEIKKGDIAEIIFSEIIYSSDFPAVKFGRKLTGRFLRSCFILNDFRKNNISSSVVTRHKNSQFEFSNKQ